MANLREAPVEPSTAELKALHGIGDAAQVRVLRTSEALSSAIANHQEELIAIVGGCAMDETGSGIAAEGERIAGVSGVLRDGLHMVHRVPVWKPRSDPESWHGIETTEPEDAYRTLAGLAVAHANPAIELAHPYHLDRYGEMIAFGWSGSRTAEASQLIERLARKDPKLPLGIKNGMDGSIDVALANIRRVESARDVQDVSPAPAVLIFRGGDGLRTPRKWRSAYLRALEATGGRLIVDTAHGSEMAHDLSGEFGKTAEGQIAAMETVLELARGGDVPAGIMIEGSDLECRTDPPMPLQIALDGVKELYRIKSGAPGQTAATHSQGAVTTSSTEVILDKEPKIMV